MNSPSRAAACALSSILIGLTQGLGIYLVNNNLTFIQGALGATAAESSWLTTAYFATALSTIVVITKIRLEFGLRRFALWAIAVFVVVNGLHLAVHSLGSAIAARAALGSAAAPLSTLCVLYMIEAMPPALAPVGLILGFASLQLGSPLARVIAEPLLAGGPWQGLPLFEVAMALFSAAAIVAVPLTQPPTQKVINRGDGISFAFYATSLALMSVVCTQGRVRWWTDTPWIGASLAGAIVCFGIFVVRELLREKPLLDMRWIATPYMIRFTLAVLLFRIVLSEQPVGAVTLMNTLGFTNAQMHLLFTCVTGATLLGFLLSLLALPSKSIRLPALIALVLIMFACWLDGDATSLTRPHDLFASQMLIAVATAMFFASALLVGFIPVIKDGMRNLVSFLAVYSGMQMLGSIIGSAWLSTFVADRQRLHYAQLVEHLWLGDPNVVTRIRQLSGPFAAVVDPAQRSGIGVATLAQQAGREAFVLAYNDLFQLIGLVAFLGFVWLLYATYRAGRVEAAQTAAQTAANAAAQTAPA